MPIRHFSYEIYSRIPLFKGLDEQELRDFLQNDAVAVKRYEKGEFLFRMGDEPRYLFILLKGSVLVCLDSAEGKRNIVATFGKTGESLGGAYLFLEGRSYDRYAEAAEETDVLLIPKRFFHEIHSCASPIYAKIVVNFFRMLSQKAYILSKKLQLLSSGNLRRKIAGLLLTREKDSSGNGSLAMNREELADYLGVARPSLSRELMHMQKDGLIRIKGKSFQILNRPALENLREGG